MWRTDTGAEAWLRRNVWDCAMKCYIPSRKYIMINACTHVCRCTSKFYVSHLFTVEHIEMRDFFMMPRPGADLGQPHGPRSKGSQRSGAKARVDVRQVMQMHSWPLLAYVSLSQQNAEGQLGQLFHTLSYSFHLRICPAWFRILRAQIVQAFCSSVDVLLMFALSMDPGQKIVVRTAVGAKTYALPELFRSSVTSWKSVGGLIGKPISFVGLVETAWAGMSRTQEIFPAANFLSTIRMGHLVFTETMLLMFHSDLVCLRINSFQQTAFGTILYESYWEPCSPHCQGLSVTSLKDEVRQYIFATPAPQPVRKGAGQGIP